MAIRLHLTSHVWNEELLIPGWIKWHQQLAPDSVTIVDHHSTDRTVEIIKNLAPAWRVIPSRLEWFDAGPVDHEISDIESMLPTSEEDWKICLNTTEYIFRPGFRESIELAWRQTGLQAFGSRSVSLVDLEENNSLSPFDRHTGYIDYERGVVGSRRWRYVHNQDYGHYHIGRHGVDLPHLEMPDWLLLHWAFAPYPLNRSRRLAIQTKMPQHNKDLGLGIQHLQTEESLTKLYGEECARSYDLLDFLLYKEYYEYWRQRRDNEQFSQ